MQPYQAATENELQHQKIPGKLLKYGGAAAGGYLARRIIPFISQYISPETQVKGLSKIDPRMGGAVEHAMDVGYSQDEINDHIKKMVTPDEEPAKQSRNIVEQYSPELHQYILEEVKKGQTPISAAMKATYDKSLGKKFKDVLDKISKQHKTPWHNIIESIYGSGEAQPKQQMAQQSPQMVPQQPQSVSQAPQQPGQGKQALMAVLQNIQQRLAQP